jgi:hypothetical protein
MIPKFLSADTHRKIHESIVSRLRAGRQGFNSGQGKWWDFSLPQRVKTVSGSTHPPIQWVPGSLTPGVKRPGHESNH